MEKLKKLKEYWAIITLFVGIICTLFFRIHNVLNETDKILSKIETTQQMALKSVIWNEEIPLTERTSACDVYLNAGYNSLTKKECETIIQKGAESGIFSYATESEVSKNDTRINIWSSPGIGYSNISIIY